MVMKTIKVADWKKIAVFASNEDKIYAYVQNELDLRKILLETQDYSF
jgi:hypothetical protein